MADDKTNRGAADRDRVYVHEDYELRYWSEKFGCTHEALKAAVNKVGERRNSNTNPDRE